MKHKYITDWHTNEGALREFNAIRKSLEEMHQTKINVIKMYKRFSGTYAVVYEVIKGD